MYKHQCKVTNSLRLNKLLYGKEIKSNGVIFKQYDWHHYLFIIINIITLVKYFMI